jgi:hypothetical protein
MQEKTINSVLNKKFNDWLESITDASVKNLVRDNTIITGGAIVSLMNNEKPNDYDLYFRNKETALAVARYYVKMFNDKNEAIVIPTGKHSTKAYVIDGKDIITEPHNGVTITDQGLIEVLGDSHFVNGGNTDKTYSGMTRMICNMAGQPDRIKIFVNSAGVVKDENYYDDRDPDLKTASEIVEELDEVTSDNDNGNDDNKPKCEKYRPLFITSNAISLSNKIQLVIRFYGEPDKIHETYDFLHCMGYWTSWDRRVVISKEVYEAVMNKVLVYKGSKYPICSMFRMRKFIKRGYNINAGQILKIAYQISELDLNNIDVLEDQLCGVDSLYFMDLIGQLRKQMENNSDWCYNQNYLISIIDKIF